MENCRCTYIITFPSYMKIQLMNGNMYNIKLNLCDDIV